MTEKIKRGRPTKLTPQLSIKIFMLSRKGLTNEEMSQVLDIHRDTIQKWQKHPDFFYAIKEAKEESNKFVERSLFERAVGYEHKEEKVFCNAKGKIKVYETTKHYPPDPTSIIFFLKNRKPEEWREKTEVEHSGKVTLAKEEKVRIVGNLRRALIDCGSN